MLNLVGCVGYVRCRASKASKEEAHSLVELLIDEPIALSSHSQQPHQPTERPEEEERGGGQGRLFLTVVVIIIQSPFLTRGACVFCAQQEEIVSNCIDLLIVSTIELRLLLHVDVGGGLEIRIGNVESLNGGHFIL